MGLRVGSVLILIVEAAAQCADTDVCASGSVDNAKEIGHTCVDSSGTLYGNTLDGLCTGCAVPSDNKDTATKCGSPYTWLPTTCASLRDGTPSGQCGFLLNAVLGAQNIDCCAAGSTSGGSDDEPCFPSSSIVTRSNGKPSRVDALREGDEIVAVTAEGSITFDTLSLLSIAHPEAHTDTFLTISTANASLTLTPTHHLPVGSSCCSSLKKAKDVVVGDSVWTLQAGKAVATIVVATTVTTGKGLHSPVLSNGHFPVVDGLVTSFDSIEKVTLAKHGLKPIVASCKATGTCDKVLDLFLGEDRHLIAAK